MKNLNYLDQPDTKRSGSAAGETQELLPCPFCGSAKVTPCHNDGLFWKRCVSCGATGPETSKYDGEEGDPFTDWNTRAQPVQAEAQEAADNAGKDIARIFFDGPPKQRTSEPSLAAVASRVVSKLLSTQPTPRQAERQRIKEAVEGMRDNEDVQSTQADAFDMPDSAKWHEGRRQVLADVLAIIGDSAPQEEPQEGER